MQLGSGTFDLLPGFLYLGEVRNWAWGGELISTIRLGENSNDYTLGNRYQLGAWVSRKWTDWLPSSVRIDEYIWGNIRGADPDLNPTLVPTADPDRRGGERINLYVPRGFFKEVRLGLEYGFPSYESLDVLQLETDWHVGVGESLT